MATKQNADKTGAAEAAPELSFEKALERLETIVREMEGGALSLEQMLQRFEEGQGLIKLCTRRLNEVEKKVELLVQKDGQVTTADFEPDAQGGEAPAEDKEELF